MTRQTPDRYLSPAETAQALGVTVKALRLYERHGLVAPLRSEAGWRAYGPDQIARLHQVLALKHLGLKLAQIAGLFGSSPVSLAQILALQEDVLAAEAARAGRALELVRTARSRLAHGERLSVDDLTQLTKETTMTSKPSDQEMKAIFAPLTEKHFTPEQRAALCGTDFDQDAITAEWDALIAEAKTLMAKGDPTTPEAVALARRWQAQIAKFTGGDPELHRRAAAVWQDAMADPGAAPRLPLDPELFAFMGKAAAAAQKKP